MDSKERIMERKPEFVQSVPTHPVSELFPTSNRPGSKFVHINNAQIFGHIPKGAALFSHKPITE